jgi:ABC-type branched-subunit amino acid transport system ATPase component
VLLQVNEIHSYYEKSHILHGVSMNIEHGEMVCLLGRNGVGKSTTLKSIIGIVQPKQIWLAKRLIKSPGLELAMYLKTGVFFEV